MANNLSATGQELRAAQGLKLPRMELGGNAGPHWGEGLDDATQGKFGLARERAVLGATVSQNLFDGGEASSQRDRQEARTASAAARLFDTGNSISLRLIQSVLEMQRSGRVLAIAQRNVEAHEALIQRLRTRKELGGSGNVDENLARARLEATKALVVEARAAYRDAETLFRSVAGFAPPKIDAVSLPLKSLPKSVEDAAAEARRVAPSVTAAFHDTRAADAQIETAKARLYPRFDAELGAKGHYGDYEGKNWRGELSAMLVMRFTLMDGGITDARIKEAQARALESRNIAANAQRVVEREVRLAWTTMEKGRARSTLLSGQLDRNRAAYKGFLDEFDIGERTLINLLDLQNEMFILETTAITEDFSSRYAVFRVLAGIGRLPDAMGVSLTQHP